MKRLLIPVVVLIGVGAFVAVNAAAKGKPSGGSHGGHAIHVIEHAVSDAQVFLVIGTSANVFPAASLIPYAKQGGAKVIEINTEDTPFTPIVDCPLRGPAAELLPKLV